MGKVGRAYVVSDDGQRGGLENLLKDLAVVASDPVKPNQRETVSPGGNSRY